MCVEFNDEFVSLRFVVFVYFRVCTFNSFNIYDYTILFLYTIFFIEFFVFWWSHFQRQTSSKKGNYCTYVCLSLGLFVFCFVFILLVGDLFLKSDFPKKVCCHFSFFLLLFMFLSVSVFIYLFFSSSSSYMFLLLFFIFFLFLFW